MSVSHLYNLRHLAGYQATRLHWTKTKGYAIPIGERRAPAPEGRPGFIRIDSVHQGDRDGVKGVYHINAVDAVTQFELVASPSWLAISSPFGYIQDKFKLGIATPKPDVDLIRNRLKVAAKRAKELDDE